MASKLFATDHEFSPCCSSIIALSNTPVLPVRLERPLKCLVLSCVDACSEADICMLTLKITI